MMCKTFIRIGFAIGVVASQSVHHNQSSLLLIIQFCAVHHCYLLSNSLLPITHIIATSTVITNPYYLLPHIPFTLNPILTNKRMNLPYFFKCIHQLTTGKRTTQLYVKKQLNPLLDTEKRKAYSQHTPHPSVHGQRHQKQKQMNLYLYYRPYSRIIPRPNPITDHLPTGARVFGTSVTGTLVGNWIFNYFHETFISGLCTNLHFIQKLN